MADKGATTKRRGRAKWIALVMVVLVLAVAAESGWLGFGWAMLRAVTFPGDEALLAYVPGDVRALAVVDPHQLELAALGGGQGVARVAIERVRADVKKVTDLDLAYDVDKLVVTPNLVVARGRFHADKLFARLAESRYERAEHGGVACAVRAGEDALAVIDDAILLYGDQPSIEAAIDAKAAGKSLREEALVLERLGRVGWNHALLVTVRIAEDRPSLREVLSGASGARAVTIGLGANHGVDVVVAIDVASPKAAGELRTSLDEKRANVDALQGPLGPELAPVAAEAAKSATVAVDPSAIGVTIRAHLEPLAVDALLQAASRASVPALGAYGQSRLIKLFAP